MTVKEFIKKNKSLFDNAKYISAIYYEDGIEWENVDRIDDFYNTSDFLNNSEAVNEILCRFTRISISYFDGEEYSILVETSSEGFC